jgi:hypothetical protein
MRTGIRKGNNMKDHLKAFVNHCKKHGIWFAVYSDGSIYECTHTVHDITFEPRYNYKIGTKKCYEWLVREVAVIESEYK